MHFPEAAVASEHRPRLVHHSDLTKEKHMNIEMMDTKPELADLLSQMFNPCSTRMTHLDTSEDEPPVYLTYWS